MRTLRAWSITPIIVPRWMVVVANALFVALGVVLALAGSPSIKQATPERLLEPYGISVTIAAVVALIGSASSRRWGERLETVGALALFCLLTVYVAATVGPAFAGDLGRAALAIVVVICSLLSAARGFSLAFAAIRRQVTRG